MLKACIIGTLLIATLLILGACAPTQAPESTPAPEPAPSVETEKLEASFSDSSGDLFSYKASSVVAEPYLDIIETVLSLSNGFYVAKIKLNGPIPAKIQNPAGVITWDILIDSDRDADTGLKDPVVYNDVGVDYYLLAKLNKGGYDAGIGDIKAQTYTRKSIEYEIDDDTVEFRFPSDAIGKPDIFNYLVSVREFAEEGVGKSLVAADKAPNEGHYVFPNHHAYVEPGLPTSSLESSHANVYYNPGNEDKARWYAEAFEYAYTQVSTELGAYPAQRFKLYVYVTQEDLVKGLQEFSGFSPQSAAFFEEGGAPRPINYVMHVCPSFGWHDMAHEYTHTIIEELSGRVFLSIKWLDEGLANYIAYEAVSKTKYKDSEVQWRASQIAVVSKALDEGRLFALKDTSTGEQWCPKGLGTPECGLQYAQAYVVVTYLAQTYGIDKCKAILQQMEEGLSQEVAVQKALGISLAQFEADFRSYLQT